MERKKNAFTLIELLAVIVILALILALAIPSILNLTNNAKKESFYQYAQSLESKAIGKYIQDMDDKTIKDTCRVYDIEKDLGLKNTGDYEGWIKVNRVVVPDPDKRQATIELESPSDPTSESPIYLTYVRYCIDNGDSCTPDETLYIEENKTSAIVSEFIRTNQVLCAYYQYPENNELKTSATECVKFTDAEDVVTNYDYDIILTIKSREYAVQDFKYSSTTDEKTFKETFYDAIDSFNEISKTRDENPMMIASPVCPGDEVTYKGTSTTSTTKVQPTEESNTITSKVTTTADDSEVSTSRVTTTGGNNPTTSRVTTTADDSEVITSRVTTAAEGNTIGEDWKPETSIPDPSLPESNATLEYIMLAGYSINFNPDIYNYNVTVNSLDNLLISYRPFVQGTLVSIEGNENLKDGSIIEIKTVSVNGFYSKTYYITIKYGKVTSENTKYLRIITITLLIILIFLVLLSALRRFRGGALFRRKIKIKDEIKKTTETNTDTNTQDDDIERLEP